MRIGIFNPYLDTRGGGEKVYLALAQVLADEGNEVTLISYEEVDLEGAAKYFGIDSTRLKTLSIKPNKFAKLINKLPLLSGMKNYFYDLSTFRSIKKQRYDLFINNCYQSNLPNPSKKGVYMCMFPQKINTKDTKSPFKIVYWHILRFIYRVTLHPSKEHAIFTYDLITANSKYTQSYIKEYWGTDSSILYPICENMADAKIKDKSKIILNVGRFFEKSDNNHHKRQDFLLESFTKLTDLHSKGWELHLAGSVDESVGGLKYILKLIKDASGYPVVFHFNSSFSEMKKLYSEANIYWHATGYGSDPDEHPEKQEHFGISTVEAMSAGSVPIVINSAGQKESVIPSENGYLWNTQNELIKYTRNVSSLSSKEISRLRVNAKTTAKSWDMNSFGNLVKKIFGDLI